MTMTTTCNGQRISFNPATVSSAQFVDMVTQALNS